MTQQSELLPCPFCGGGGAIDTGAAQEFAILQIVCTTCGGMGPFADTTDGDAEARCIKLWNTRASGGESAIIAWLRSEEAAARGREAETGEAKHAALAIFCRESATLIEAGEHRAYEVMARSDGDERLIVERLRNRATRKGTNPDPDGLLIRAAEIIERRLPSSIRELPHD